MQELECEYMSSSVNAVVGVQEYESRSEARVGEQEAEPEFVLCRKCQKWAVPTTLN